MTRLLVWGASGHARVVSDALGGDDGVTVVGFLDDDPHRRGADFAGASVLGGREVLGEPLARGARVHVAIGHCRARLTLGKLVLDSGFALFTVTHRSAICARDVTIGDGSFLAAGAIVNANARLGALVILNTGSTVDHDCVIDDGVHVGPGAHLGGAVTVGRGAWIGIGAVIKDRVRIGEGAIVGAGAVVVRDVPANFVAYGVPARPVRPKNEGE